MPLCGFNEKMIEGLRAFHKGLVEYGLIDRSKMRNQSIDETISREISDMERFLAETPNLADCELRGLIESLTIYAKSFYKLIERKGVQDYKNIIKSLDRMYVGMDNKFYKDLEGKPNDMRNLVNYLNSEL